MAYLLTTQSTWFQLKMRLSTQKRWHKAHRAHKAHKAHRAGMRRSENRFTNPISCHYTIRISPPSKTIRREHLSKKVQRKLPERPTYPPFIHTTHSCFIERSYLMPTRESSTKNSCVKPPISSFYTTSTRDGPPNTTTSIMGFGVSNS